MIDMQWYQVLAIVGSLSQNHKIWNHIEYSCSCAIQIVTIKFMWSNYNNCEKFYFLVWIFLIYSVSSGDWSLFTRSMYTYVHNFKGIAGISFTGKDNSMYGKEPCSLPQNLGLMLIPITLQWAQAYYTAIIKFRSWLFVSRGDITNNRKGLYSFDMHEGSVLWVLWSGGWALL